MPTEYEQGNPGPERILGIDPGLNITGYGVIESSRRGPVLLEAGVVRGTPKTSLTLRVAEIYEGVREIVGRYEPHAMAIEELYSHYKRPRTAILMGHARGVLCLAAAQGGMDVHHYPATKIKKLTTGNGRASKEQIQHAIQREFRLDNPPEPPDVADALAAALCHYHLHGLPQMSSPFSNPATSPKSPTD